MKTTIIKFPHQINKGSIWKKSMDKYIVKNVFQSIEAYIYTFLSPTQPYWDASKHQAPHCSILGSSSLAGQNFTSSSYVTSVTSPGTGREPGQSHCHHVTMSPCHHVTMSPCHHVIMSPCMSLCYHAMLVNLKLTFCAVLCWFNIFPGHHEAVIARKLYCQSEDYENIISQLM